MLVSTICVWVQFHYGKVRVCVSVCTSAERSVDKFLFEVGPGHASVCKLPFWQCWAFLR